MLLVINYAALTLILKWDVKRAAQFISVCRRFMFCSCCVFDILKVFCDELQLCGAFVLPKCEESELRCCCRGISEVKST